MIVTDRDLMVLQTLGNPVRCMVHPQIAAAWWPPTLAGYKNAAKRLFHLVRADLLRMQQVLAHPLLPLECPAVTWRPGEPAPAFPALAWRLQNRWTAHPLRRRVYFCAPRAIALLGSRAPGKLKNLCQLTHDLHVAQVYLAYRRWWPELATHWVGEDAYTANPYGEKIPDALLIKNGIPYRAVEFGGRYPASRLIAFHNDCVCLSLPYEIW